MNYFTKLFTTGAIRETPKQVIETLLRETGNRPKQTVVEIGAGKGELTRALLNNRLQFSGYFAFEIDREACAFLKTSFPQILVKHENAFAFADHLPAHNKIDLFLSSIPLSFYSGKKINELLNSVKQSLTPDGKLVIVFTAFWLIPFLKKALPGAKLYSFFTFPPYFLLVYQRQ